MDFPIFLMILSRRQVKDKLLELETGSRTSTGACQKADMVKQESEKDLEAAQGHVTSSESLLNHRPRAPCQSPKHHDD